MTYKRLLSKLDSARRIKSGRKLQNNTRLTLRENDGVKILIVRLHQTNIILAYPDNTFQLNTNGWETTTTRDRITSYSPARIYSICGQWFIFFEKNVWRFQDGAKVDSSGKPMNLGEGRPYTEVNRELSREKRREARERRDRMESPEQKEERLANTRERAAKRRVFNRGLNNATHVYWKHLYWNNRHESFQDTGDGFRNIYEESWVSIRRKMRETALMYVLKDGLMHCAACDEICLEFNPLDGGDKNHVCLSKSTKTNIKNTANEVHAE